MQADVRQLKYQQSGFTFVLTFRLQIIFTIVIIICTLSHSDLETVNIRKMEHKLIYIYIYMHNKRTAGTVTV